ncbi:unnamed protein product, partial [marine sediment metagenome]
GDPGHYRPSEELEKWQRKDPIKKLRKELLAKNWLEPKALEELEQEVAQDVQRAVEFARKSPYPAEEELTNDIFGGDHRK